MSDFKVVLPTTTEEWQRDMKLAYNKAIDNVESEFLKCDKVHYNLQDILRVLNKLNGE